MKVTIGGNRLGSGNKQITHINAYERSTHNLSQKWASSMGVGMLYPFLCIPAMRGDHFSIDLQAAARTIPTEGPLFGSFKLQADLFQVPLRLYQALLHNNPLALGLNMSQVKLPKLRLSTKCTKTGLWDTEAGIFSNSCLIKYLGMSGMGTIKNPTLGKEVTRDINAVPLLAYYDIFKNYYANKQEENAYIVTTEENETKPALVIDDVTDENGMNLTISPFADTENRFDKGVSQLVEAEGEIEYNINFNAELQSWWEDNEYQKHIYVSVWNAENTEVRVLSDVIATGASTFQVESLDDSSIKITYTNPHDYQHLVRVLWKNIDAEYSNEIAIRDFTLSNIDDMRMDILSHHTLGSSFIIDKTTNLPYGINADQNKLNLNGLALKTYQADLFNAWINTEWLDGENGIAEITKIAVTDGGIYIDSMLLANKLYNMLNRVALAGGTYEDWQDAVYEESPTRHIESPLFIGGLSSEVVFEEIVQTTPAEGTPLGTLGGRGILLNKEAGQTDVKFDEAGFVMGIVSLTPRIYFTQGNEFYLTELDSIDDLHKPALDGIGFQNLIEERALSSATSINASDSSINERQSLGKVPAWIEYMTAVDRAYGDFADVNGNGFMILNRNYEKNFNGTIKDATTYIDPSKYNYAFAVSTLDAQNFWVEIDSKIEARRLMSAKQIPNL